MLRNFMYVRYIQQRTLHKKILVSLVIGTKKESR